MPVSYEKKFIFFHIPRCGGTSIDCYYKFHDGNPLFGLRRRGTKILTLQHLNYQEIEKEGILTDETLQSFFKFTIIRDPFLRMASDYYWQLNHDFHKKFEGMSFQAYLDFAEKVIAEKLYFDQMHYDHFRPMKEYCYSDNKLIMDEILVLDRIDEDIKKLCSKIGLDKMFRANSSSPRLNEISTKENIERTYSLYAEDKELYEQVLNYKNLPKKWVIAPSNPETELRGSYDPNSNSECENIEKPNLDIALVNSLDGDRPQYRLGDAVLKRHTNYGEAAFLDVADNPKWFSETILYDYSTQIDRSSCDLQWPVLRECTDRNISHKNIQLPDEHELVVHIRLGEAKGLSDQFEQLLQLIEKIYNHKKYEINKVTLVSAIHFGKQHILKRNGSDALQLEIQQHEKIIEQIIAGLLLRNISHNLYSHADIDNDFSYLANAHFLVLGNGHFSMCAAMISKAIVFIPPYGRWDMGTVKALRQRTSGDCLSSIKSRNLMPNQTTAILCLVRNEHPYIMEWLEYHVKLGFDRIYMISTDDDYSRLETLISTSPFSRKLELHRFNDFHTAWQFSCYQKYFPSIKEDWAMIMDLDEYLYLHSFEKIQDYLSSIDSDIGQIQFPWLQVFTHNYYCKGVLNLLHSEKLHSSDHVKSIARTRCAKGIGIHSHYIQDSLQTVLSSKTVVEKQSSHDCFIRDPSYYTHHPFIFHFCSRGHFDVLTRILDHKFDNTKGGNRERHRVKQFLLGESNISNLPNRFLLLKLFKTLPEVNLDISMPVLESTTDVPALKQLFRQCIDRAVDFQCSRDDLLEVKFEKQFQLQHKLDELDLSRKFDIEEYLRCKSQLEYVTKFRLKHG